MAQLTYGTRLTIAHTAVFAIALLAFSAIAYATVRYTLYAQLETRLLTTATAVRTVPDVRNDQLLFDPDDREQFLELLADNGVNGFTARMDGSIMLSNLERPPREILALRPGSGSRHGEVESGNARIAYAIYPIWHGDREHGYRRYGYIVVWVSRAIIQHAETTVLFALLAASGGVIVLALLIGRFLVGRMLRPIHDLSSMMSEIEVADLTERLAWDGPDDELGRLCTTFDRLLDRLESAFERERRFVADASHELRTPIAVLRAEVELALNRERSPDEYRAALVRLQREVVRLELLTENLLLTARAEAVATQVGPVDVAIVVERACTFLAPLMQLRDVHCAIDGSAPDAALAEASALERAFIALLDNALRFSPPHGTIRVTIFATDDAVTVAIADQGPGFTEAALRDATQRFWRDDPARSGHGTGLGLSIVRVIVDRFGGSLTLGNSAEGAVVTVRLVRSDALRPVNVR